MVNINCSKIKSFSVVTSFLICPSFVKKFCIISRSITDIWFYKIRIQRNWNNDWFWSFQSITDNSICNLIWVLASRLLTSLPLSLNSTDFSSEFSTNINCSCSFSFKWLKIFSRSSCLFFEHIPIMASDISLPLYC